MNWVPLFQTIAWIALILYAGNKFSFQVTGLLEAIRIRVEKGSSLKAGPIELGEDLKALEKITPSENTLEFKENDWSKERDGIYQANNGIFITHVIEPSTKTGQLYDIFIYLVRHKSNFLDDVEYAEFFLGSYWGNKVFKEINKNGLIGISTSAYGPLLCTCKVKMKDGKEIRLNRYIDFEMGRAFKK